MPPKLDLLAVDLFSGAGGVHLGLEGIAKVVLASEIDRPARATYAANFPDTPLAGDVRALTDFPPYDLLCGGFPCQPFSQASRNGVAVSHGLDDPRGNLFLEIVRILRDTQPKGFILENVPGLLSSDDGQAIHIIMGSLIEAGYAVDWQIINSSPWVPQNRKRIYFRGVRSSKSEMLQNLFELQASKIIKPPRPHPVLGSILHEFFDPEFAPPPMDAAGVAKIRDRDRDRDHERAGRGFKTTLVGAGGVARTLTARYASANRTNEILILMDDDSFDVSEHIQVKVKKYLKSSGRSSLNILSNPDRPSKTLITAGPGRAGRSAILLGKHGRVRRITPREAARLMGFPEWFVLPEVEGQAYKQMGNAVVPQVVHAVAQSMLPLLARIGEGGL